MFCLCARGWLRAECLAAAARTNNSRTGFPPPPARGVGEPGDPGIACLRGFGAQIGRGCCVKRDERDEPVRVYVSTGAAGGRRGSQLLDGSVQAGAVSAAESQLHRVLEPPH